MKAYVLKEILENRGGQVPKAELLKMECCEGERMLKNSIRYLLDLGLVVETKETLQAKTALGKLVPEKIQQTRKSSKKEESGRIPSAKIAGAARAARMREASEAAFPERLEAVRQGKTLLEAFGTIGKQRVFKRNFPEKWKLIEDAIAKNEKDKSDALKVKVLAELAREPMGAVKLTRHVGGRASVADALAELAKLNLIVRDKETMKWRRK